MAEQNTTKFSLSLLQSSKCFKVQTTKLFKHHRTVGTVDFTEAHPNPNPTKAKLQYTKTFLTETHEFFVLVYHHCSVAKLYCRIMNVVSSPITYITAYIYFIHSTSNAEASIYSTFWSIFFEQLPHQSCRQKRSTLETRCLRYFLHFHFFASVNSTLPHTTVYTIHDNLSPRTTKHLPRHDAQIQISLTNATVSNKPLNYNLEKQIYTECCITNLVQ